MSSSLGSPMPRTPILTSTPYQPPPPVRQRSLLRWLPIVALVVLPVIGCVWGLIAILRDDSQTSSNAVVAPQQATTKPASPTPAAPTESEQPPLPDPKSEAAPPAQQVASAKPPSPEPAPAINVPQPAPPKIAVVPVKQLTEEQKRVNAAIDRGIEYLKKSQTSLGIWGPARGDGHTVGHAALPGLALLECGVPRTDPVVQKAAATVRFHASQVGMTYDLALAILFLDRLGDEKDVPLIQMFAARIIAAQNAAGGWHYHCPRLQAPDAKKLLTFLQASQPRLRDMVKSGPKLPDPIQPAAKQPLVTPVSKDPKLQTPVTGESGKSAAAESKVIPPALPTQEPKKETATKKPAPRVDSLPVQLRQLPVVLFNKKTGVAWIGQDDNSNTQFALLGLWAARRHNVPVEKSLEMADLRFQKSQNRDGGWGYHVGGGSTPTMTCVGLLGLAMGHGSAEAQKKAMPMKADDKAISQGLRALGKVLENDFIFFGRNEFYFLWSVERVGMLYNLSTIGGVDWYKWGTKIILPKQHGDGAWRIEPGYDPAIDTSFALLFLKRSNLVQDLSNRLQLYLAITDPAAPRR